MKKAAPGSTGKSGNIPKSGTSVIKSSAKGSSSLNPVGKLPNVPFVSKTAPTTTSYKPTNKKSTTFGLIWLPTKKRNKQKDLVYNSHKNDHLRDRAPSMYNFMSGDSSSQQTFSKKKEDESNLILPEPSGTIPVAIGAGAGAVAVAEVALDNDGKTSEETQDLIKHVQNESKEAAGDTCDKDQKSDKDYLENSEVYDTMKGALCKVGDNVDSVFLRSPPPHKTRSNVSTPNSEDEDCCIKCLYYTLQCCDCAIM